MLSLAPLFFRPDGVAVALPGAVAKLGSAASSQRSLAGSAALTLAAGPAALTTTDLVFDIDFTAALVEDNSAAPLGSAGAGGFNDSSPANYLTFTEHIATTAISLTTVKFKTTSANAGASVRAAVYANDGTSGQPGTLLAQSADVVGVTSGTNTLTLSAPLALTNGQTVWVASHQSGNFVYTTSPNGGATNSRFVARAFASGLPATAPATSALTSQRYDLWGEGTSLVSPAVAQLAAAGFTFARSSIALALDGTVAAVDTPRLGASGLLVEGSRTNHFTYSNDFANAAWTKVGVTPTTTAGTAPGGVYGSTVMVESSATELHYGYQPFTFLATTAYVWSAYAKAVSGTRWVRLTLPVEAFGTAISANFDLTTGAATTTGGSPTCTAVDVGSGWWRVSIAATTTTGGLASAAIGMAATASGTATYAGNGSSSIRVAFAQLETGSSPSSPIPTTSAAAARAAESCVATRAAGVLDQGTVAIELTTAASLPAAQMAWDIDDDTANNRLSIYRSSGATALGVYLGSGGVSQASIVGSNGTAAHSTTYRLAVRWAANNVALAVGGTLVGTDTSATVPAMTIERLGTRNSNAEPWTGYIRRVRRWARVSSDAHLQSLSS